MSKFGNISIGFFSTSGSGGGGGGLTFQQCVGDGNSANTPMLFESDSGNVEISYDLLRLRDNPLGTPDNIIDIQKDKILCKSVPLNRITQIGKNVFYGTIAISQVSGGSVYIEYSDLFYQTLYLPSCNGRLELNLTQFEDNIDITALNYTINATQSRSYKLVSSSNVNHITLDFPEGLTMYIFISNSVGSDNIIFVGANGTNVYGLTNARYFAGLVIINRTNGAYWIGI